MHRVGRCRTRQLSAIFDNVRLRAIDRSAANGSHTSNVERYLASPSATALIAF